MNNRRKVEGKLRNIQVSDAVWVQAKLNAVKKHASLLTYTDTVMRKALGLPLPPYSEEILGVEIEA